jgi:indolepyruvate ferredoxin oxidoreductase alpha subunit
MEKDACSFPINSVEIADKRIGFITSGVAYQYVKEACPEASVLKLGIVNPLPRKLIEDFVASVDTVYIFEELEPVIEEQVRAWGLDVKGKELFTKQGEYSANMLKKVIYGKDEVMFEKAEAPARPPILCPGCPHRSVFSVLNKLKIHAAGDIGCYTLGAVAPLNVIDTTICMGSSISVLHGMEMAKGKDYVRNWVATIGDSTFLHTGINSLVNMVYNKATGTVMILDNRTTGMTGHQEHAATGKTLKGTPAPYICLEDICAGLGIAREHIRVVDPADPKEVEKVLREENKLDFAALCDEAYATKYTVDVEY